MNLLGDSITPTVPRTVSIECDACHTPKDFRIAHRRGEKPELIITGEWRSVSVRVSDDVTHVEAEDYWTCSSACAADLLVRLGERMR